MSYHIFIIIFIIFIIIIIFITNTTHNNHIVNYNYNQKIIACSPKIIYLHNFITSEESEYFISYINNYKNPSLVHIYDKNIIRDDVRTSSTAYINPDNIHCINVKNRVAKYFKSDVNRLSQLQGNLYEKNQFYKPHYDFFIPRTDDDLKDIDNNRSKTMIIYLNDVPESAGGATVFPKINVRVYPKKLNALYFEGINNNKFDYNTLHGGESINGNYKKYIMNIWDR
jgi:prolyl 4-hydroxylase